ncbi:MAG TPA: efflux RND transporter periplasmic adaptor subunit, partial [Clostridia bacterium]
TQLEVARQQLSMANEGARSEDKMGAEAQVIQAQANVQARASIYEQAKAGVKASEDKVKAAEGVVAEVDAYLKDTLIKAASDGVITEINSHEGELVSTGVSIGTLSKLKNTWVTVKVKETDLSKISVNQEVDIKVPAFSKSVFKGKVATINQKPDFATKRATNDNGDFDILSYGVKIDLSDNDNVLRPGMTAFVQFRK